MVGAALQFVIYTEFSDCWRDDHYKILLHTKQLSFTDPFIEVFYLGRLFSYVNHGDFMVYTCFLLTAHISVQPFQPCFFLNNHEQFECKPS